jgi:outer membrane protein OmpA-like peptidoglycan-associated protein
MLDRMPDTSGPAPFSLVERAPLRAEAAQEVDPHRVAGEDAPLWLAAGFAIIGTIIAIAAASAWQQDARGPAQPPAAAAMIVEPPRQDRDELSAEPPPLPRETVIPPQPQPTAEIPPPPIPPASAAPAPLASPAPPAAATVGTATPQVPDRGTASAGCFGPLIIAFPHNSARPNRDDVRKSVGPLRQWLSTQSDAMVLIEGRSDTTGTEDYNVLLSYSRAKAVASLLKSAGIPARHMTIRAAGPSEAAGGTSGLTNDRSALVRIAGVEDCGGVETATKGQ